MGKYVSFDNLSRYDGKIKEYIDVNSSKIGKLDAYDYSTAENALVLESLKPGVYILWTNGSFDIHFKSLESSSGTRHIRVSGSPEKLILILTQTPTSTLNEWNILGAIITNSIGFNNSAVYTTNYILNYKTSDDGNLEIETVQTTTNATIADIDTAQTISGKKTFSTLPESSVVPTTNNQFVNKSYVDNNSIKPITANTNIWDLTQGVYKVDAGIQLYYKDSGYLTIGSYGCILVVSITDNSRTPFYLMGRGVLSSDTSNNHIIVGIAQNSSYGVYDKYNMSEMNNVVHTINNQTISGVKTFNSLPICSVFPTNDYQLVNKSYVDSYIVSEDSIKNLIYKMSEIPVYDPGEGTYSVGDYVYNDDDVTIYRCKTSVTTPEEFDSTKWDEKTYLDYLKYALIGDALGGSY